MLALNIIIFQFVSLAIDNLFSLALIHSFTFHFFRLNSSLKGSNFLNLIPRKQYNRKRSSLLSSQRTMLFIILLVQLFAALLTASGATNGLYPFRTQNILFYFTNHLSYSQKVPQNLSLINFDTLLILAIFYHLMLRFIIYSYGQRIFQTESVILLKFE